MLIGYVTTDEVHYDLFAQAAEARGIALLHLHPQDFFRAEDFDALVYDLDYLPTPYREKALSTLTQNPPCSVHSYHLDAEQIDALQAQGVRCARGPEVQLLDARSSMELPGDEASDLKPDGGEDLDWMNWVEETFWEAKNRERNLVLAFARRGAQPAPADSEIACESPAYRIFWRDA